MFFSLYYPENFQHRVWIFIALGKVGVFLFKVCLILAFSEKWKTKHLQNKLSMSRPRENEIKMASYPFKC